MSTQLEGPREPGLVGAGTEKLWNMVLEPFM